MRTDSALHLHDRGHPSSPRHLGLQISSASRHACHLDRPSQRYMLYGPPGQVWAMCRVGRLYMLLWRCVSRLPVQPNIALPCTSHLVAHLSSSLRRSASRRSPTLVIRSALHHPGHLHSCPCGSPQHTAPSHRSALHHPGPVQANTAPCVARVTCAGITSSQVIPGYGRDRSLHAVLQRTWLPYGSVG